MHYNYRSRATNTQRRQHRACVPNPYSRRLMPRTDDITASRWRALGALRAREVRYGPNFRQPRHAHDHSGLAIVLAGAIEETSLSIVSRASAGSVVTKPAGCWHADHYGPRGALIVQVEFDDLDPRNLELPYRWTDRPRMARWALALRRCDDRFVAQFESLFWDELAQLHPCDRHEPSTRAPGWWCDALDGFNSCVDRPVSVSVIAQRVSVHPVHLARVCRQQLGRSARRYMLERRVLAAWRACERDEDSLAAIALRSGFSDQSHMTRTFQVLLGTPPSRLRRLTRRLLGA